MTAADTNDAVIPPAFEDEKPVYADTAADRLLIDIEGFEGPIDVLLTLARDQKVDLTRISILALADQYLAFVAQAREIRLELAADYLVMAAWLAYLKSRLLLPAPPGDDEPSGAEMAAMLAFQLQRLEAMKTVGGKLMERAQIGRDVFVRGEPEVFGTETHTSFEVSLYDILRAYGKQHSRQQASTLHIAPTQLYSIEEALSRLRGIMGKVPDWTVLVEFLPRGFKDPILFRSAVAATFVASLELTRSGNIEIRQGEHFAPLYIRTARRPA